MTTFEIKRGFCIDTDGKIFYRFYYYAGRFWKDITIPENSAEKPVCFSIRVPRFIYEILTNG